MKAGLRPALTEVPAFDWHQGPTGPTKALWAYPENFITEPQTDIHSIYYIRYYRYYLNENNVLMCLYFILYLTFFGCH